MTIQIRPARSEDYDVWIRLRFELWPECPLERHRLEVEQIVANPGVVALAIVDGKVVGFAELSVRSDHVEGTAATPVPYLEGWVVAAAHRGRGIGCALLSFVEEWAIAQGFSEIASDTELGNLKSIRLHERLGFREVGRSVHFVKTIGQGGGPLADDIAGGRSGPGSTL